MTTKALDLTVELDIEGHVSSTGKSVIHGQLEEKKLIDGIGECRVSVKVYRVIPKDQRS